MESERSHFSYFRSTIFHHFSPDSLVVFLNGGDFFVSPDGLDTLLEQSTSSHIQLYPLVANPLPTDNSLRQPTTRPSSYHSSYSFCVTFLGNGPYLLVGKIRHFQTIPQSYFSIMIDSVQNALRGSKTPNIKYANLNENMYNPNNLNSFENFNLNNDLDNNDNDNNDNDNNNININIKKKNSNDENIKQFEKLISNILNNMKQGNPNSYLASREERHMEKLKERESQKEALRRREEERRDKKNVLSAFSTVFAVNSGVLEALWFHSLYGGLSGTFPGEEHKRKTRGLKEESGDGAGIYATKNFDQIVVAMNGIEARSMGLSFSPSSLPSLFGSSYSNSKAAEVRNEIICHTLLSPFAAAAADLPSDSFTSFTSHLSSSSFVSSADFLQK